VAIDKALFKTKLLKTHSQHTMPLFNYQGGSNAAKIQECLIKGFHVIRRLWTMAARVIRAMELTSGEASDLHADTGIYNQNITQLTEAYFEVITITSDHPISVRSAEESPPDSNQESGDTKYQLSILQRQRTTYLITLHYIKLFILNTAI
jgi:hypothetical protein